MKRNKTSYYTLTDEPALKWMIIISVAAHFCLLIGALVIPDLGAAPAPFEPAYSVELVDSQPASSSAPKEASSGPKAEKEIKLPEPKPDPTPRVDSVPETVESDTIPIVKKPRSQKVVVNKEPTEKRITEQLERIEKQAKLDKQQQQSEKVIDDVIAKLRNSQTASNAPSSNAPATEGVAGSTGNIGLKLQLYKTRIWNKVRGNWSFPEILAAKRGLEAVILVSVSSDGKILSQRLTKTSGDPLFDQSVMRAVKLSDPLPPFPDGYVKRYEELELRFNLGEMAKLS